jgi:hypothetical protein
VATATRLPAFPGRRHAAHGLLLWVVPQDEQEPGPQQLGLVLDARRLQILDFP